MNTMPLLDEKQLAIVNEILERADDAGDNFIASACRRLLTAYDWHIVKEMYDLLHEDEVSEAH